MLQFLILIIKCIFLPLSKIKKEMLSQIILMKKENQIMLRTLKAQKKRIKFKFKDKVAFAILSQLCRKFKKHLTIVRPETILCWYKEFLKNFWTHPHKNKRGRPETPVKIKNLILRIKNDNPQWGIKKIQGELIKLGEYLDKKTISKIIRNFRRKGKIRKGLTWAKFIKSHLESLYAMDFFTATSILGTCYYIFFIIHLKTRRIESLEITRYPNERFVTFHLTEFAMDRWDEKTYLIHDRDPMFRYIKYRHNKIDSVMTSSFAPNMNVYAERFVRTVRNEALDYFIIFNQGQLKKIIKEFVGYYNSKRPHPAILSLNLLALKQYTKESN